MKRRYICWVFVISALSFLVLQMYLWHYGPAENDISYPKSPANYFIGRSSQVFTTSRENLMTLALIVNDFDLWLTLLDPDVLTTLTHTSSSHLTLGNLTIGVTLRNTTALTCRYLCSSDTLTTVGVTQTKFLDVQAAVLLAACDAGFHTVCLLADDRITHCFLTRHSHTVHVVVMMESQTAPFWHHTRVPYPSAPDSIVKHVQCGGGLVYRDGKLKPGVYKEIKLGHYDAAYDWIPMHAVKLDGVTLAVPQSPARFLSQLSQSRYIPCNETRAKEFVTTYPQNTNERDQVMALLFKKRVRHLLAMTKQILDELHIPFWISSGTCLGWFRQCDVIPYSGDVDIGIWIQDYNTSLINAMEKQGLPLKFLFGLPSDSFELSFQSGEVKLDVFFFYQENDYVWNGGTQARTGNKYKYIFPKFTLCWTEFLDLKLRVPCDTESYVRANYGVEWFKPVKQWDWKLSPPNVRPNGRWPEDMWPEVIQFY